ncbi:YxlC family protein [Paenibacillus roseipurpureus]|uniref:YxlC family protein n=1 Tax=Paenibacillus roseopurpureus TaxID=2918901 RepID=A0AA96LQW9_9BACL|nr:YxlC family protein [Paenibacillus sp. MBLB1832]WNR44379.1 YxlC family protein [Paenibacillus sp. MBLB1832]
MDEDVKGRRSEGQEAITAQEEALSDAGVHRQLREGLAMIDRATDVPTPSAAWFERQIANAQSRQRSRLIRDLLILWIGALLVFYVFYLTVSAQPAAFLSIQAAAILIPAAWLLLKKQVTSHENN